MADYYDNQGNAYEIKLSKDGVPSVRKVKDNKRKFRFQFTVDTVLCEDQIWEGEDPEDMTVKNIMSQIKGYGNSWSFIEEWGLPDSGMSVTELKPGKAKKANKKAKKK